MAKKRIVILGSSFAGLMAALRVKRQLGDEHQLRVLSKSDQFFFLPSLIWVPFDLRTKDEITFPVRPICEEYGIDFKQTAVSRLNLPQREVVAASGVEPYDYLLIATGAKSNYAAVPGLGPRGGYTQSIYNWDDAVLAGLAFGKFVQRTGPVVIGAVQGASGYGAAYEFLFNMAFQLKRRGMREKAPITYITSEPYLGHFGLGGKGTSQRTMEEFFRKEGIAAVTNAAVREIRPGEIVLEDRRAFPFAYAMLAPPIVGVEAIRACDEITTPAGLVRVSGCYQTEAYPEVFAAGAAVAVAPAEKTPVPCGVPITGYLSERMAQVAAYNIVASIRDQDLVSLPPGSIDAEWALDAGNAGMILGGDRFLEPGKNAWLLPGPAAHWAKLARERYFMTTRSQGQT